MTKKKKKAVRRKRQVTIEQIVEAAFEAGAEVRISLAPKNGELRALLATPPNQWPGDPSCRTVIADRIVTNAIIERTFKDNPSSQWVITPYDIIAREDYFRQKAAWEAEELRQRTEIKCIGCGTAAAFPELVSRPYICIQCQQQPKTEIKP